MSNDSSSSSNIWYGKFISFQSNFTDSVFQVKVLSKVFLKVFLEVFLKIFLKFFQSSNFFQSSKFLQMARGPKSLATPALTHHYIGNSKEK